MKFTNNVVEIIVLTANKDYVNKHLFMALNEESELFERGLKVGC